MVERQEGQYGPRSGVREERFVLPGELPQTHVIFERKPIYDTWMDAFERVADVVREERRTEPSSWDRFRMKTYAAARHVDAGVTDAAWSVLGPLVPIGRLTFPQRVFLHYSISRLARPSDLERLRAEAWVRRRSIQVRLPRYAREGFATVADKLRTRIRRAWGLPESA